MLPMNDGNIMLALAVTAFLRVILLILLEAVVVEGGGESDVSYSLNEG
jgi:hypothetical protein